MRFKWITTQSHTSYGFLPNNNHSCVQSEWNENSSQRFSKAPVLRLSILEGIPILPKTGGMAQSQNEPLMNGDKMFL